MAGISYPKPSRKDRKADAAKEAAALKKHRAMQRMLAIDRDNSLCVYHFFNKGVEVQATEVHHVFGRGTSVESVQEGYRNLVCTCRSCHPQPSLAYSEKVVGFLKKVNEAPINKNFKHLI